MERRSIFLAVMVAMPLQWHRVSAAKVQHPPTVVGVILVRFRLSEWSRFFLGSAQVFGTLVESFFVLSGQRFGIGSFRLLCAVVIATMINRNKSPGMLQTGRGY